jgi:predicted negative regulator of RcsB-dependent stress response
MAASEHQKTLQELKQPDPFFEAIEEARAYYAKNKAKVLGMGGSVALLFALVAGLSGYYSSQGARAAADFSSAVSNLEFDSPSAAEVDLKNLSERANAGPYKALASLYRGNIASGTGRQDEAITAYDQFLSQTSTEYLRQIGLMGKAAALEKSGKAPEAAAALDQAAAIEGPYRTAALADRARLAAAAGAQAPPRAKQKKQRVVWG